MKIIKQIGSEVKAQIEDLINDGNLPGFTLDGYTLTYEADDSRTLDESLEVLEQSRNTYLEFAGAGDLTNSTLNFLGTTYADLTKDLGSIFEARKSAVSEAAVGNVTDTTIAHSASTESGSNDSSSTQSSVETSDEGDTSHGKKAARKSTGTDADGSTS